MKGLQSTVWFCHEVHLRGSTRRRCDQPKLIPLLFIPLAIFLSSTCLVKPEPRNRFEEQYVSLTGMVPEDYWLYGLGEQNAPHRLRSPCGACVDEFANSCV